MYIAIIDDMPSDRLRLKTVLQEYAAIHDLEMNIRCFSGAEEFLSVFLPHQYTILFLDIFMEGMSGTEAAAKIRAIDDDVLIVFVTASEEHRAEAFESFASAYLTKTAGTKEIYRTLDHILHLRTDRDTLRFHFTSERREFSLPFADIVCLQADGNYILVTDRSGNTRKTRMIMADAEKRLSVDARFLPIIRGVIVNLDYVLQITADTCILRGGVSFPISVRKSRSIQQVWYNYNFENIRREAVWKDASNAPHSPE